MTVIDPNNPPAKIVYSRNGATLVSGDGFTLVDERKQVAYLRTIWNFEAANNYRPICIVRLKAWK